MVFTNVVNPRSEIAAQGRVPDAGRRGATLGANATIVCGVTIGPYAFVGAGAVVTRDVPDFALVLGTPRVARAGSAATASAWARTDVNGVMRCPESGYRYQEIEPGVLKCLDLDEEAPLPAELSNGTKSYRQFKDEAANACRSRTQCSPLSWPDRRHRWPAPPILVSRLLPVAAIPGEHWPSGRCTAWA